MVMARKDHALDHRTFTFEQNNVEQVVDYYACRCNKSYFNQDTWGYARRNEARKMHREHLDQVTHNGT